VNKITIKEEVKEVIKRNLGDVNNTIETINQMILIYSILKTDKSLVKSQRYESLSIELQELKTLFQIEKTEYFIKLNGKRDCKDCELYRECDYQGAYQKDGKWCYEYYEI